MTDKPTADFSNIINRSPRTHIDADIAVVVATLRDPRSKFAFGNKQAGSPKQLTGEKAELAKLDIEIEL